MPTPNDPLADISVKRADQDIMSGLTIDSGYAGMEKSVKGLANIPGLTETILPSIKALLMPGADNPAFKAIDVGTQQNVASAQTDAMRRGLTGSDIEAASMTGARSAGEMAKSNFQAQTATQMAGFIKDLATGDINAQRENLTMFAQLLGQKITNDQDLMMFQKMLEENMAQASRNRKSSLWGAGIGAAGSVAGSLISTLGSGGGGGGGGGGTSYSNTKSNTFVDATNSGSKFSDERLKIGIRKIGEAAGLPIVIFRWTRLAQAFGAHSDEEVGVLAQDVEAHYPEAVSERGGWKMVDYTKLPASVFDTANRLGAAYA